MHFAHFHLQATSRNSLLMSILQQMLLEDEEDRVKVSAISSIAFIVTFIDDDDKYAQVLNLMSLFPKTLLATSLRDKYTETVTYVKCKKKKENSVCDLKMQSGREVASKPDRGIVTLEQDR